MQPKSHTGDFYSASLLPIWCHRTALAAPVQNRHITHQIQNICKLVNNLKHYNEPISQKHNFPFLYMCIINYSSASLFVMNLAVARDKCSLLKHGDTVGAVPSCAVVSNSACVFSVISSLNSPSLQKDHHVSHFSHNCSVRQLEVIFWVPITATWIRERQKQLHFL